MNFVGGFARKAETDKISHYAPLSDFVPFVVETSGVWGEAALELSKRIGKRLEHLVGEKRSTAFL